MNACNENEFWIVFTLTRHKKRRNQKKKKRKYILGNSLGFALRTVNDSSYVTLCHSVHEMNAENCFRASLYQFDVIDLQNTPKVK